MKTEHLPPFITPAQTGYINIIPVLEDSTARQTFGMVEGQHIAVDVLDIDGPILPNSQT